MLAITFTAVLGALLGAAANVPVPSTLNSTGDFPTDYYGVDVSQPYGTAAFKCLKGLNLRFAIVRCYESVGRVDPSCAGSVAAAHAGGIDSVHAYMFPCPKCGNGGEQVATLLKYWEDNHVDVARLWLDIEGTQYWMAPAANQAFYRQLVDACTANKLVCGVYSSASQWNAIFGSTFVYGNDMPLWYAHYDNTPAFSDFQRFGGWAAPTIKQFSDQGSKCGVSYDINWSPALPRSEEANSTVTTQSQHSHSNVVTTV